MVDVSKEKGVDEQLKISCQGEKARLLNFYKCRLASKTAYEPNYSRCTLVNMAVEREASLDCES